MQKQMSRRQLSRPNSRSLYFLLGIAGALVGAEVADTLELDFFGTGAIIWAILGAAFFVIGWRQLQPPYSDKATILSR